MNSKNIESPASISLDDFLAEGVKPRGKVSRLLPFSRQIDEARTKHLSYDQIVQWLARNGVTITKQSLNQWVHRRATRIKKIDTATNKGASVGTCAPAILRTAAVQAFSVMHSAAQVDPKWDSDKPAPWDPHQQRIDMSEFTIDELVANRQRNPLIRKP